MNPVDFFIHLSEQTRFVKTSSLCKETGTIRVQYFMVMSRVLEKPLFHMVCVPEEHNTRTYRFPKTYVGSTCIIGIVCRKDFERHFCHNAYNAFKARTQYLFGRTFWYLCSFWKDFWAHSSLNICPTGMQSIFTLSLLFLFFNQGLTIRYFLLMSNLFWQAIKASPTANSMYYQDSPVVYIPSQRPNSSITRWKCHFLYIWKEVKREETHWMLSFLPPYVEC